MPELHCLPGPHYTLNLLYLNIGLISQVEPSPGRDRAKVNWVNIWPLVLLEQFEKQVHLWKRPIALPSPFFTTLPYESIINPTLKLIFARWKSPPAGVGDHLRLGKLCLALCRCEVHRCLLLLLAYPMR